LKGIEGLYLQAAEALTPLAFAELCTAKVAVKAAEILYDRNLSFFVEEEISVEVVLTEGGKEYKSKLDIHPYGLLLQPNDLEHFFTKVGPQDQRLRGRFHGPSWTSSSGKLSWRSFAPQWMSCRETWAHG
jgi:hypothetical protein